MIHSPQVAMETSPPVEGPPTGYDTRHRVLDQQALAGPALPLHLLATTAHHPAHRAP